MAKKKGVAKLGKFSTGARMGNVVYTPTQGELNSAVAQEKAKLERQEKRRVIQERVALSEKLLNQMGKSLNQTDNLLKVYIAAYIDGSEECPNILANIRSKLSEIKNLKQQNARIPEGFFKGSAVVTQEMLRKISSFESDQGFANLVTLVQRSIYSMPNFYQQTAKSEFEAKGKFIDPRSSKEILDALRNYCSSQDQGLTLQAVLAQAIDHWRPDQERVSSLLTEMIAMFIDDRKVIDKSLNILLWSGFIQVGQVVEYLIGSEKHIDIEVSKSMADICHDFDRECFFGRLVESCSNDFKKHVKEGGFGVLDSTKRGYTVSEACYSGSLGYFTDFVMSSDASLFAQDLVRTQISPSILQLIQVEKSAESAIAKADPNKRNHEKGAREIIEVIQKIDNAVSDYNTESKLEENWRDNFSKSAFEHFTTESEDGLVALNQDLIFAAQYCNSQYLSQKLTSLINLQRSGAMSPVHFRKIFDQVIDLTKFINPNLPTPKKNLAIGALLIFLQDSPDVPGVAKGDIFKDMVGDILDLRPFCANSVIFAIEHSGFDIFEDIFERLEGRQIDPKGTPEEKIKLFKYLLSKVNLINKSKQEFSRLKDRCLGIAEILSEQASSQIEEMFNEIEKVRSQKEVAEAVKILTKSQRSKESEGLFTEGVADSVPGPAEVVAGERGKDVDKSNEIAELLVKQEEVELERAKKDAAAKKEAADRERQKKKSEELRKRQKNAAKESATKSEESVNKEEERDPWVSKGEIIAGTVRMPPTLKAKENGAGGSAADGNEPPIRRVVLKRGLKSTKAPERVNYQDDKNPHSRAVADLATTTPTAPAVSEKSVTIPKVNPKIWQEKARERSGVSGPAPKNTAEQFPPLAAASGKSSESSSAAPPKAAAKDVLKEASKAPPTEPVMAQSKNPTPLQAEASPQSPTPTKAGSRPKKTRAHSKAKSGPSAAASGGISHGRRQPNQQRQPTKQEVIEGQKYALGRNFDAISKLRDTNSNLLDLATQQQRDLNVARQQLSELHAWQAGFNAGTAHVAPVTHHPAYPYPQSQHPVTCYPSYQQGPAPTQQHPFATVHYTPAHLPQQQPSSYHPRGVGDSVGEDESIRQNPMKDSESKIDPSKARKPNSNSRGIVRSKSFEDVRGPGLSEAKKEPDVGVAFPYLDLATLNKKGHQGGDRF